MKATKLLLIAIISSAVAASSAVARPSVARTAPMARNSHSVMRASSAHWRARPAQWRNQRWAYHRHHRSRAFFNIGFGYPFGYGYPYYGYYPYGYYRGPREVIYQAATVDRSTAVQVQQRLAQAGYYRGAIDGVIGAGTRNAIRSYERDHGLRVDGLIDPRLLATMGLA
jgi:hypothetical protein